MYSVTHNLKETSKFWDLQFKPNKSGNNFHTDQSLLENKSHLNNVQKFCNTLPLNHVFYKDESFITFIITTAVTHRTKHSDTPYVNCQATEC
jgi:hypothetical protein